MPYRQEYCDPELFLEYKGVEIYHTYYDEDIDRPESYQYSLTDDEDDDSKVFDIRELCKPLGIEAEKIEVITYKDKQYNHHISTSLYFRNNSGLTYPRS